MKNKRAGHFQITIPLWFWLVAVLLLLLGWPATVPMILFYNYGWSVKINSFLGFGILALYLVGVFVNCKIVAWIYKKWSK